MEDGLAPDAEVLEVFFEALELYAVVVRLLVHEAGAPTLQLQIEFAVPVHFFVNALVERLFLELGAVKLSA